MKKSYQKIFFWLTMVMLLILLVVQVKWIVYSFRFQEKVFRNSVDLALDKTIANLNSDQMVCDAMRECMRCDTLHSGSKVMNPGIWDQIHTSIDSELTAYGIDLDYDLFITRNNHDTLRNGPVNIFIRQGTCYTQSLREVLQTSGYQLVVSFPDRSRFFMSQAGLMLFSSVILILLIIFSIIKMAGWYRNELRLSENIKELINNVTHEFKTPITSIALAANLIRKGRAAGQPAKIQEYGELIFKENQKLEKQVESLLDLAAIERDDFDYHFEPEHLRDIIAEAFDAVKLLSEEKNGTITCDLTEEDDLIQADKLHLTNAISNILVNALKYSSGPPVVRIRSARSGHNINLEISDQGIGIPLKYQKYIFDKYYRVPTGDVHDIKGFGIGLSYVKNVVAAHKGKISVSSEPGNGSRFSLLLPALNLLP